METPQTRVELRPHHGGISVPDLDASAAWHSDNLGFTLDLVMDIPEGTGRLAFLKHGDFRIELFEVPGAAPLPDDRRYVERDIRTHGMKHIAYLVSDVGQLIEDLKAKGVDAVWDIRQHGDMKAAFIRDNSGNLIELMEPVGA